MDAIIIHDRKNETPRDEEWELDHLCEMCVSMSYIMFTPVAAGLNNASDMPDSYIRRFSKEVIKILGPRPVYITRLLSIPVKTYENMTVITRLLYRTLTAEAYDEKVTTKSLYRKAPPNVHTKGLLGLWNEVAQNGDVKLLRPIYGSYGAEVDDIVYWAEKN